MAFQPKLVRDRIPEIIIGQGKVPVIRELGDDEYTEALLTKLIEEVQEVIASEGTDRLEELADVLELMKAIAAHEGVTLEEIEKIRVKKAEERGGFKDRIFLEEIREG